MMNIFATHDEKARKAHDDATSQHSLSVAALEAHLMAPADRGDFNAIKHWEQRKAELQHDVDIAKGVVEHWRGIVARHETEAAEKAADAAYTAAVRQAENDEKLVHDIVSLCEKLAAKRDALKLSVERTAAANAGRGTRPFIVDAETRVREVPGRTIPAEFRDETIWCDGAGNQPSVFRTMDGETLPVEQGYTRKAVRIEVSPERIVLPKMPTRFADALNLVGLDGQAI